MKKDKMLALNPVRWWYARIARTITNPTGKMALTPSFPVDVLIKSAPKVTQNCEIKYFIQLSAPTAMYAIQDAICYTLQYKYNEDQD